MNYCSNLELLKTWGYKPSLYVEKQSAEETIDSDYTGIFGLLTTQWAIYNADRELILQADGVNLNISDIGNYRYLDTAYFMNHSGDKNVSPLIKVTMQLDGGSQDDILTYYSRAYISNIIRLNYCSKWNRLISAFNAEYNPIHNYDMTEQTDITGSNNDTETINGTDTLTHGKTVTTNITNDKNNGSASVYGFDSVEAVPISESETNRVYTESVQNNGVDKTAKNATNISNGQRTEKTILTRSGNIGVTTSQQMLESEIELRKHNILDIIFKDIDNILTIPIY